MSLKENIKSNIQITQIEGKLGELPDVLIYFNQIKSEKRTGRIVIHCYEGGFTAMEFEHIIKPSKIIDIIKVVETQLT